MRVRPPPPAPYKSPESLDLSWLSGLFPAFFRAAFFAAGTVKKRGKRLFRIEQIEKSPVPSAFPGLRRPSGRPIDQFSCGKQPGILLAAAILALQSGRVQMLLAVPMSLQPSRSAATARARGANGGRARPSRARMRRRKNAKTGAEVVARHLLCAFKRV